MDRLYENPNIKWDIFITHHDPNGEYKSWTLSMKQKYRTQIAKKYNNNIISKEFISGYRYLRNNVFEELMSYVWHPSRVEKWKYLDNDIDL